MALPTSSSAQFDCQVAPRSSLENGPVKQMGDELNTP
jgi:hypothetical protein